MTQTTDRTRPVLQSTTYPRFLPSCTFPVLPGRGRAARTRTAVLRTVRRVQGGLQEAAQRPDRGDISITTVIIWVAAVTGAALIAGTIAVVVTKYNGKLSGV
ncbi:hypothetical protein [Streptomyces sp. NPDC094468]|uniref:hypothetical protein n=1 Tax=Streptomyces sp. NPDC094468 TaxID=3366066 RepID=UPI003802C6E9